MVNLPFGRFIPGETILHRIDPRVKLLGAAVLITTALLVQNWWDLLAIVVFASITVIAAQVAFRELLRDILTLRYLYIITLGLHCFLGQGRTLIQLPMGLGITEQGIYRGLFFAAKIALLTTFIGFVMRSTHPASFTDLFKAGYSGSSFIRKVTAPLALTFGIAIRFLPLILEETERIRWAQVSRGFDTKGGLIKRVKSLNVLIIPLISSSLNRVDKITLAMQARGFRLDGKRTIYQSNRIGTIDYIALLMVAVVVIVVIF
ncbi:MAG: energy-coupling factor transporter transmembrane component T [Candidatus Hatepunaea meridiana]|nr:energy-coupling factor transporter transmembrane component T [Candidatus Hatepunaea meridiana]